MHETYVGDYQVVAGYACRPGNAGMLAKLLCDSVLCFTVWYAGHAVFCNLLMVRWLLGEVCPAYAWKGGVGTVNFATI